MGRRSSRPSGGRRPAPRRAPARSASTRAASPPAPRRQSASAQKPTSNPPSTQKQANNAPAPAAAQSSPMGGFMANVASTGLGVMAGRAMDRTFFGGGNAPAPEEELPPQDSNNEFAVNSDEIPPSVCAREAIEFKKCMDRTASDVTACQWNLDILAACQQQEKQTGFAEAGRF